MDDQRSVYNHIGYGYFSGERKLVDLFQVVSPFVGSVIFAYFHLEKIAVCHENCHLCDTSLATATNPCKNDKTYSSWQTESS